MEFIQCRLCGRYFKRMTAWHLEAEHPGITLRQYKEMFPEAPLMTEGLRKEMAGICRAMASHSCTEEARENIGRASEAAWARLSPEEKKERLRISLHSKEAREAALEVLRSPGFRGRASRISLEDWAKYTFEERQELVRKKGFCPDRSQVGESNYNWRGGHDCGYGYGWKDTEYFIFVRDGFTCQKCGTKDFRNNPITCHHIDYDKENMEDGNLITLCRRCNLEVNGDRWYWKVYFRKILGVKMEDVLLASSSGP